MRKYMRKSFEEKLSAVEDYIKGRKSVSEIAADLSVGEGTVKHWIFTYRHGGADALRFVKITAERKKEIIEYCIKNNRNYKGTATLFHVPYGTVYRWVREQDGKSIESERFRRKELMFRHQLKEDAMVAEMLNDIFLSDPPVKPHF